MRLCVSVWMKKIYLDLTNYTPRPRQLSYTHLFPCPTYIFGGNACQSRYFNAVGPQGVPAILESSEKVGEELSNVHNRSSSEEIFQGSCSHLQLW